MKITILQTGKTTEKHVIEGVDIYSRRLKKYCVLEIISIADLRDARNMPVKEHKEKEGKRILQSISRDDILVLLDERGKEFRTVDFAKWLDERSLIPGKRIVFAIGGAWGFSDEVYKRADHMLSLSKLTFPHQLVRLLFIEQLYRAFTIIKGEPYHHE